MRRAFSTTSSGLRQPQQRFETLEDRQGSVSVKRGQEVKMLATESSVEARSKKVHSSYWNVSANNNNNSRKTCSDELKENMCPTPLSGDEEGDHSISMGDHRHHHQQQQQQHRRPGNKQQKNNNNSNNSTKPEFVCSQCRTLEIDSHLVTLKKLRDKALRYTNQLDEIRAATKKREKELSEVMERLQTEEKNLQEELENVDELSFKMNMRRNQLRQDQITIQQEESEMSRRLQALKEKEIFVSCQMVKLQSQEAAIKARKRELQKEKLRIEKLAYLIFKTDLNTMTYREFRSRIGKLQYKLEKRYRKLKLVEHYCQHKNLPLGMKLEPVTPIAQSDTPRSAYEEVLWRRDQDSSKGSATSFQDLNDPCNNSSNVIKKQEGRINGKLTTINNPKHVQHCCCNNKHQDSYIKAHQHHHHHCSVTTTASSESNLESGNSRLSLTATKRSRSEQTQDCKILRQEVSQLQRLISSAKDTISASARRLLQTPVPEVSSSSSKPVSNYELKSNNNSNNLLLLAEDSDGEQQDDEYNNGEEEEEEEDFEEEQDEAPGDEDPERSSNGTIRGNPCLNFQEDEGEHEEQEEADSRTNKAFPQRSQRNQNPQVPHHHNQRSRNNYRQSSRSTNDGPPPHLQSNYDDDAQREENPDEDGLCSLFRNAKNDDEKLSSQSLIQSGSQEQECCCAAITSTYTCRWKNNNKKSNNNNNNSEDSVSGDGRRRRRSDHEICTEELLRVRDTTNKGSGLSNKQVTGKDKASKVSLNAGDRYDDYEELLVDRLAKLPQTTRNEIAYAIGQKAFAQIAQVLAVKHSEGSSPANTSGDPLTSNTAPPPCQKSNHEDAPATNNTNTRFPPQDSSQHSPESYVKMYHLGLNKSQRPNRLLRGVTTGAKRIPSHLKFGNFGQIRRGSRRNIIDATIMDDEHINSNNNNNSYSPSQHSHTFPADMQTGDDRMTTLEPNNKEDESPCSSQHKEILAIARNVCCFQEAHFSAVGAMAEKILGISSSPNPSHRNKRGGEGTKLMTKLSHTKPFRV